MKNIFNVLIMLSTFNGEKYLREQLDSLYAQKDVDIHILARDDGSKDGTLTILNDYKEKYGKMTIIKGQNVGAGRSFFALMDIACKEFNNFNYYAFSDQDDVWLHDKLKQAVDSLEKRCDENMRLFYCESIPTDCFLKPIFTKSKQKAKSKNVSLGSNIQSSHSLGCTQVFSYGLLKKASCINSLLPNIQDNEYIPLHDGWISLVAFSFDGYVYESNKPLIYYRQHGNNVVGNGGSFITKNLKRVKRYINGNNIKSNKCRYILNLYSNELPKANIRLLKRCAYYRNSISDRIRLLFTKQIYQNTFIEKIGVACLIITGNF